MGIRTLLLTTLLVSALAGRCSASSITLPQGRTLEQVDFERHVHALLDRQGCNAGKCHGNRDGRGGLTLSLFAGSPEGDFHELARRARGRYLNVADPDQSLLLLKATGRLPHEGGIRVIPGSWEYAILRQWIAEGARREPGRGAIKNLRVVPHEHIFQPLEHVQLKVIAEFADGSNEDVTAFSDFRVSEADIVDINAQGRLHAVRPGDVGIQVFYRGRARVMRAKVAVPVARDFAYPKVPEVNFIDREIFRELRRLNIAPSELSSDELFLRRVTIDLLGTLPTPAEVCAFQADKDPDKRTKKIDELLVRPLHASLLAMRFCERMGMIVEDRDVAKSPNAKSAQFAHGWLRRRLLDNMPYDRIVEGILTATSKDGRDEADWQREKEMLIKSQSGFGVAYSERATLDEYWRHGGPVRRIDPVFGHFGNANRTARRPTIEADAIYLEDIAERTASAFLGISLECARCHDHPIDGWTPTDHRAFANLFGHVGLEKIPFKAANQGRDFFHAAFGREVYVKDTPLRLPRPETSESSFLRVVSSDKPQAMKGEPLAPRMLGGPEAKEPGDPRHALVHWLRQPDHRFFARHFVNVTWEHYFGASLVDTSDGYTSALPSAHRTLLDLLAKDFVEHRFDIRRLERLILTSRVYQLSFEPNATNKHDRTHFARVVPRRFTGRIAAGIVLSALEMDEGFDANVPPGLHVTEVMHLGEHGTTFNTRDDYGERIARLVQRFGRAELVSRCENESSVPASYLYLYGGPRLESLFARSKRVQRLVRSKQSLDDILDECFLATLSRLPTPHERKVARDYMAREPARERPIENIFWAIINANEFAFRR